MPRQIALRHALVCNPPQPPRTPLTGQPVSNVRLTSTSRYQLATLSLRGAAAYGVLPPAWGRAWAGDGEVAPPRDTTSDDALFLTVPACRYPPEADFGDGDAPSAYDHRAERGSRRRLRVVAV